MNSPRAPKFTQNGPVRPRPVETGLLTPEILVVEDGTGLLANLAAMLQDSGFHVILAPDAHSARRELANAAVGAVIAGASRQDLSGLRLLAAFQERRAGVKTLVLTSLGSPELPVQAYEMELDDYLHWPLSPAELNHRLKDLLELGGEDEPDAPGLPEAGPDAYSPSAALGFLVSRFTESLSQISQSLEDLHQEYLADMADGLAQELQGTAAQIRALRDNLRQGWRLGAPNAASGDPAPPPRFH